MPTASTIPAKDHSLTKSEHYAIFRQYMEHEDNLINHRLSWNLSIQGFLFASYAFSVQKLAEIHTKALVEKGADIAGQIANSGQTAPLRVLVVVIPLVGLLMAGFVWFAVYAARLALEQLEKQWREKVGPTYPDRPDLPEVAGGGVPAAIRFGFRTPLWIQGIFMGAWVVLWVANLLAWLGAHF